MRSEVVNGYIIYVKDFSIYSSIRGVMRGLSRGGSRSELHLQEPLRVINSVKVAGVETREGNYDTIEIAIN